MALPKTVKTLLLACLALPATARSENRPIKTIVISEWMYVRVSWYGKEFHGKPTSNGERYNMHGLSAANWDLPFGTLVTFYNPANKKTVTVRINDRGPFDPATLPDEPWKRARLKYLTPHPERAFDLSRGAAKVLDIIDQGVVNVYVKIGRP